MGYIYYILVSGKVQDVFLRKLDSKKVEIMAVGNKNTLDRFVDYLKRCPGDARVDAVFVREREDKPFKDFEIKD